MKAAAHLTCLRSPVELAFEPAPMALQTRLDHHQSRFARRAPLAPPPAAPPAPARSHEPPPAAPVPARRDGLATLLRAHVERRAPVSRAQTSGPLLQRYEHIVAHVGGGALQAGHYRVLGGNVEFEAQQVTAGPGAISGPVAPAASPPLRVSDDARMAVEDTNLTLRQPKVFYARPTVWQASNLKLAAAGSEYELYADRANAIRVQLADGTQRTLDRVLARTATVPAGGRMAIHQGMTLMVGTDCVAVAKSVMQHADSSRMPRLGIATMNGANVDYSDYRTARAMAEWVKTEKRRTTGGKSKTFWKWFTNADSAAKSAFGKALTSGPALNQQIVQTLATSYEDVMTNEPALADQAARQLGLNLHADADVGEAYETYRIAIDQRPTTHQGAANQPPVRDFWAQHIGGVIAKSGGDKVTLENYQRGHEVLNVGAGASHYYFQMYGPASKPTQTWHGVWTGAGAAGAPVGLPAAGGMDAMTAVIRHA